MISGKAVFRLDAGKRTRVVPDMPLPLPFEASWRSSPDAVVNYRADGREGRVSSGLVWQVEEEWDGKQWRRYYGYVTAHAIMRVSAEEIDITDYRW